MTGNPIANRTIVFAFDDGPMAGKSFVHSFHSDGTVDYHASGGKSPESHAHHYEAAQIRPDLLVVSYLGGEGYTLTTVLDFANKCLVAFSSNQNGLQMSHGTFTEHM